MSLFEKASKIKAVILDIDGVLTDGRIGYGGTDEEIKFFDVKDGLSIKLMQRTGIKVGVLSGRKSKANARRIQELGLDFHIQGASDKGTAFENLLQTENLKAEECMYIGDDLIDAPAMNRAGLAIAVGDAVPEILPLADFHTRNGGGRGAVREAAEMLLREQNKWRQLVESYTNNGRS